MTMMTRAVTTAPVIEDLGASTQVPPNRAQTQEGIAISPLAGAIPTATARMVGAGLSWEDQLLPPALQCLV